MVLATVQIASALSACCNYLTCLGLDAAAVHCSYTIRKPCVLWKNLLRSVLTALALGTLFFKQARMMNAFLHLILAHLLARLP